MGAIGNDKKGSVMTVLGPIAAADMGTTLIHEHLFVDLRPPAKRGPDLSDIEISIEELGVLHRQPFHLAHIERQPQKAYSPQQATGNLRLFALRDRPSSYEVFSRNPAASCRE